MDYCVALREYDTPRLIIYELVGTLDVGRVDGEAQLVLENVRLPESQRLIEENWEPILADPVDYACP